MRLIYIPDPKKILESQKKTKKKMFFWQIKKQEHTIMI